MHAAFPRSEYYGGSAPPAPSAGVAPIHPGLPGRKTGNGTHADGSRVHCCPVDGFGIRLLPDWPLENPAGDGAAAQGAPADSRAVVAGGVRQDHAALLACALGRPTRAIGPDYAQFDGHRRAPRLPGPPYHFMTRIVALDGRLGGMRAGSAVTAEYDVPAGAWYFEQNGAPTMPFAVLMDVTLQPCGWLAMYVGSVLGSEADLLFRNLDGTGTVLREVLPGTRALRTEERRVGKECRSWRS